MSGILLLLTCVLFNQSGDVMPLSGAGAMNAPAMDMQRFAQLCQRGWGPDPKTGRYTFVIQIAPEALAAFSAGQVGNDLVVPVPPEIRPFVEETVVRIGTGRLDQIPPTAEMKAALLRREQPFLATLDSRNPINTPVNIDPVVPASNGNGLINNNPSQPGYALSNLPNSNASMGANPNGSVLPPTNNNSVMPPAYSEAPSLSASNNPLRPAPAQGAGAGYGNLPSTSMTQPNDSFRSATSTLKDRMFSTTGANPNANTSSPVTPYATANSGYSRVANNGNAIPNQNNVDPYANQSWANNGYGAGSNGYAAGTNTQSGTMYPPGVGANLSRTGVPSTGGYLEQPFNPQLASATGGVRPPNVATGSGTGVLNGTQTAAGAADQPRIAMLDQQFFPFITILLLVGNIYQFFWMSHVRTRYKEMVISKRNAQLGVGEA